MNAAVAEAIHALEGLELSTMVHTVTDESIARFVHAVGITDQVHLDGTAARQRGYRAVVAPLSYYLVVRIGVPALVPLDALGEDGVPRLEMQIPDVRAMAGETFVRFRERIYSGDVITLTRTVTDVTERTGRSGQLFLVHLHHVMVNQHDEVVVDETYTRIFR